MARPSSSHPNAPLFDLVPLCGRGEGGGGQGSESNMEMAGQRKEETKVFLQVACLVSWKVITHYIYIYIYQNSNITEIYLFNQSNIGKNNYGYSIQNVDSLKNGHTIITKDIFY